VRVRVQMGAEHYALGVEDVVEVADVGELTPLPGAPRPFLGVRNLRGEVLPVIDLAALLGVTAAGEPERIVIAQAGRLRAGLAVERVLGVGDLPAIDTPTESPALKGAMLVDGKLVGVVDVPAVLSGLAGGEAR
jgi:chemotaxis signal transduction protein